MAMMSDQCFKGLNGLLSLKSPVTIKTVWVEFGPVCVSRVSAGMAGISACFVATISSSLFPIPLVSGARMYSLLIQLSCWNTHHYSSDSGFVEVSGLLAVGGFVGWRGVWHERVAQWQRQAAQRVSPCCCLHNLGASGAATHSCGAKAALSHQLGAKNEPIRFWF